MNDVNSTFGFLVPTIFDFVKVKRSGAVTSGTMTIVYCGCTLLRFNKIRRISGRYSINSLIVCIPRQYNVWRNLDRFANDTSKVLYKWVTLDT